MKCELKNRTKIIDNYVHGKLSEEEREAFDEHCFNCERCSRELMFYEETVDLIRKEGETVFSEYLERSRQKTDHPVRNMLDPFSRFFTSKPWRYAIAGVSLVIIITVFIWVRPAPETSKNFEILPYLEGILSDAHRSESVTVLSPEIGETVKDRPTFKWTGMEDETIYLVILDNLGNKRFAFMTDGNQFFLQKKLNPGLYYWKLESEEDLLFLGKFIVKR